MKPKISLAILITIILPLVGISQDFNVNGNLQLNTSRSTFFTQGDYALGHRGGIQFLTFDNGNTFIFQPTNQNGTTVNSTLRMGGFGSFSSNTVNLAVTGNIGVGTASPVEKLDVQGNINLPMQNSIGFLISSDKFSYDSKNVGNYSLGWSFDSWNASPSTYLSGYGGIKFFTSSVPRLFILNNGNIGVGTQIADQKLTVNGKIKCEELQVVVDVADYVFEENYPLKKLEEVEQFIKENKHLPGVPGKKEINANGYEVGLMTNKLLEKVEELMLYVIESKKENENLKLRLDKIEKKK